MPCLEPEWRERSRYIRSLGAHPAQVTGGGRGSEARMRPFAGCRSTLRNEPNFGLNWLSYQRGWRFERRSVRERGGGLGSGGGPGCLGSRGGGLEVLESFEGTEE